MLSVLSMLNGASLLVSTRGRVGGGTSQLWEAESPLAREMKASTPKRG